MSIMCLHFLTRRTLCDDLVDGHENCPLSCSRRIVISSFEPKVKDNILSSTIVEQIIKELKYAEKCHPNQDLSKADTMNKAIEKLREAFNYSTSCRSCATCTDNNKFLCSAFAAIAILIRGIECEIENSDIFKPRNEFFEKKLKEK